MSRPKAGPRARRSSPQASDEDSTDAVEPTEEDGDGPWVVADAVAGAVHDAELGVAVGVDEDSGIEHWDEVVVAAVDDEEGTGCDLGAHATARISRSSHVHTSTSAGNVGSLMMPTSPACSRRRLGCDAQSSKSAGAPRVATPRTCRSAAAAQSAERAAGAEAGQPHARDPLVGSQVADRHAEVVEPAGEGEAALRLAAAAEGEGHGQPAHLRRQAVGQLRERRGRHGGGAHLARVAVGQHHRRDRDRVGPHRRPGEVRGQEVPARREAELHAGAD